SSLSAPAPPTPPTPPALPALPAVPAPGSPRALNQKQLRELIGDRVRVGVWIVADDNRVDVLGARRVRVEDGSHGLTASARQIHSIDPRRQPAASGDDRLAVRTPPDELVFLVEPSCRGGRSASGRIQLEATRTHGQHSGPCEDLASIRRDEALVRVFLSDR